MVIKTAASIIGKLLLSLVIVFGIVIVMVIVQTLIAALSGTPIEDLYKIEESKWSQYGSTASFIVASYFMYKWFERKKGWKLGWIQQNATLFTIHGLLAGILLISISALLIWGMGGISWELSTWNQDLIISLLWGILLFVCVAVSEEIFSRGYVQGLFRYHYGSKTAIVVSSILFALLHSFNPGTFDSPIPIVNLFLAGVIMAVAREVTGGLWWPIGLHMTWNFFQGNIYGFSVSGTHSSPSMLQATDNGPAIVSGGSFGAEGSVITSIILIIGIAGVYYFYNKRKIIIADESAPSLAQ